MLQGMEALRLAPAATPFAAPAIAMASKPETAEELTAGGSGDGGAGPPPSAAMPRPVSLGQGEDTCRRYLLVVEEG